MNVSTLIPAGMPEWHKIEWKSRYRQVHRTSSCKCDNLQSGEIGLAKDVNFEIRAPGQDLNEVWSVIDQDRIFGTQLLVHNCREACCKISILDGVED